MRNYGEIKDVIFIRQGWNIYNLAFEYKLSYDGEVFLVYVTSMAELKKEIANLIKEGIYE